MKASISMVNVTHTLLKVIYEYLAERLPGWSKKMKKNGHSQVLGEERDNLNSMKLDISRFSLGPKLTKFQTNKSS